MAEVLAQSTWPYRVFGTLFALFAVIALVMSAVGLYAVMAYSVTQRTPEIGVRMAMGATGRQVSWLILKRGLVQLGLGLGLGLLAAVGLSRVLRTLLVQITPTDPPTFVAITVVLTAVAIGRLSRAGPPRHAGRSAGRAQVGVARPPDRCGDDPSHRGIAYSDENR